MYQLFKYVLILSLVTIFWSCANVPEENMGKRWGLRSAEVVSTIEFKNESHSVELDYHARVTSEKYTIRMLFPEIDKSIETFEIAKDINKQFGEFEFKLVDVKENQLVDSIKYTYEPNTKGVFSYLARDSLVAALRLDDMHLKKNQNYKIYIKIPERRNVNPRVQNVILALGIKSSPSLLSKKLE